jgi:acetyl-CoA acetyltransferase
VRARAQTRYSDASLGSPIRHGDE